VSISRRTLPSLQKWVVLPRPKQSHSFLHLFLSPLLRSLPLSGFLIHAHFFHGLRELVLSSFPPQLARYFADRVKGYRIDEALRIDLLQLFILPGMKPPLFLFLDQPLATDFDSFCVRDMRPFADPPVQKIFFLEWRLFAWRVRLRLRGLARGEPVGYLAFPFFLLRIFFRST